MPRRYQQRNDDAQTYRKPSVSSLSLVGPQRGAVPSLVLGRDLGADARPRQVQGQRNSADRDHKMGRAGAPTQARHPLQGMRQLLSGVDAAKMLQVGQCLAQFTNGSGGHSLYWGRLSGIAQRAPSDFLLSCAVVPDSHRTQGRIQTSSFPRRGFTIARGNALE